MQNNVIVRHGASGGYVAVDTRTGEQVAAHATDVGALLNAVIAMQPAHIGFGAGAFNVKTPIRLRRWLTWPDGG